MNFSAINPVKDTPNVAKGILSTYTNTYDLFQILAPKSMISTEQVTKKWAKSTFEKTRISVSFSRG